VLQAEAAYWDALLRDAPIPAEAIDPTVAAIIARLHALDESLHPEPAFAARLESTLLGEHPSFAASVSTLVPLPPTMPPVAPTRRQRSTGHRGVLGALATAALVLLTLLSSYGAFQRSHDAREPGEAALIPALVGPLASPSAVTVATLFTTVLPAERIPTAEARDLIIWNLRFAPGVREAFGYEMAAGNTGLLITHVVAGELTLTVDGPVQVRRNALTDATTSEWGVSGEAILLQAGDTAVFPLTGSPEFANLGSTPTQVIIGGYDSATLVVPAFHDAGITFIDSDDTYPLAAAGSSLPVQATLTRASLPAQSVTMSPPPGSLVVRVGADEDVSIGENSNGSLRNVSPRTVTLFVLTMTPLGADVPASVPTASPQAP
jgi:hypothetical protein